MPRPTKCRRVCRFPETLAFSPAGENGGRSPVTLTVDEYETIRLIDWEGLSQEACSKRLQVARTTAQKIYDSARRKLSQVLVQGLPLRIEGGEVRLCDGKAACGAEDCALRQLAQEMKREKGENTMRIAVAFENGMIFQHFGHTEQFKLYDVEDGAVQAAQVISTNGSGHGALAGMLQALKADAVICGGIGGGAQAALAAAGIRLYGGVTGDADGAVAALLAGKLLYNPNVKCDHHGAHSHGEGHHCGEHGCGEHTCGHSHGSCHE